MVVGATPAELTGGVCARRQGLPGVPAPVTHEEYALARTERKTAPGYRGFHPHRARRHARGRSAAPRYHCQCHSCEPSTQDKG